MNEKPIASLSLDLDNKWSYLRVHGDEQWKSYPSYLDIFVPRFLEIMEQHGLKITVFVVGRDASFKANHRWLKAIADAGHEIANHSFEHQPWLHRYSREELDEEFDRAEDAIEAATGKRPVGFRGPGFSLSEDTLQLLIDRGYQYDASTLPTYIGPLARAYYFMTAKLSNEERDERDNLFGSMRDGMRSAKPYRWQIGDDLLLEIPVTTIPVFKVPFHFSYLIYLAQYSAWLSRVYFRFGLGMCRLTSTPPSILLHPLDFLGKDDVDDLEFFPGMRVSAETKLKWIEGYLGQLSERYRVVNMSEQCSEILKSPHRINQIRYVT